MSDGNANDGAMMMAMPTTMVTMVTMAMMMAMATMIAMMMMVMMTMMVMMMMMGLLCSVLVWSGLVRRLSEGLGFSWTLLSHRYQHTRADAYDFIRFIRQCMHPMGAPPM